jgi:GxxExxY protein
VAEGVSVLFGSNMDRERVASLLVKSFYAVYNELGYGFLERNYENALALEIRSHGLLVEQQKPIEVFYRGQLVGSYFADLLIENCIIVEIKAVEQLVLEHEAQLLNYLKATNIDLGFVINFGRKPEVKRKIYNTIRR